MTQTELIFRAEDLQTDEVLAFFVEGPGDREIIDALKGRSAVILRGSRGVGKSFLMRVAEAEMVRDEKRDHILPVYLTYSSASLLGDPSESRFFSWMMSKIIPKVQRAAARAGLALPASVDAFRDPTLKQLSDLSTRLEMAWASPSVDDPAAAVPSTDDLKDAVEDLCRSTGLRRIVLLVDEAAHVFVPAQLRQFFTLMREIRSPYLAVKAAVYPGATSYGTSFQLTHDAKLFDIERDATEPGYTARMKDLVLKQQCELDRSISQYGEEFAALAFAAQGNPRILLKTLSRALPLNRRNTSETLKGYYRESIWADHTSLADRYPGHKALIDWGRAFLEDGVLPEMVSRNADRTSELIASLWIHRDAPRAVKEALNLLCYSGILQEDASGIRATRSEIGTRYVVNFGCQISSATDAVPYATHLRQHLSIKRMIEYGANHPVYSVITDFDFSHLESTNASLESRLSASIDVLDLTQFQMDSLIALDLVTVGSVLQATEEDYKKAYYVGEVRARKIRNAAVAAVLEYLSG